MTCKKKNIPSNKVVDSYGNHPSTEHEQIEYQLPDGTKLRWYKDFQPHFGDSYNIRDLLRDGKIIEVIIAPHYIANIPFVEEMTILDYSTGRSSVTVELKDSRGQTYSMFMSDFIDTIKKTSSNEGKITGQWQMRKQGKSYGLVLKED